MATNSGLKNRVGKNKVEINADSLGDREIIDNLISKKIKFHELDGLLKDSKAAAELRLQAIEKIIKKQFIYLRKYSFSPEEAKPNIENLIGAVEVPLGIAGPLKIKGEYAEGDFFIPMATTEGALVASVNRGCSVIAQSGGASVKITKIGQTRSIMLVITNPDKTLDFFDWIDSNYQGLKREAEKSSRFLRLLEIKKYSEGDTIWLRLVADTGDAMGMNMLTIAAKAVGEYVEKNYPGIVFLSESGNLCIDKKPSRMTFEEGRGRSVVAEVRIPSDVVQKYLKTTPEKMADINYRKNHQGSKLAGSFGYNAQFANVIAAVFLATGQDIAHVVEGSHGTTEMKVVEGKNLHVKVTIPAVLVGTVGGGTHLPCQRECLEMLDCYGSAGSPGDNASRFAEIIAGAVLAGEISLIGALCARQLSDAHIKYNR